MKLTSFRTAMMCLAIIAFFTFTTLGIFLLIRLNKQPTKCPIMPRCAPVQQQDRDRLVLNDPLYPPLNRTDKSTHERTMNQIKQGNLYQSQNQSDDAYRLIGYITSNSEILDAGRNNWKLFARMKDRNMGEYYIVPTNNTIDLKIPLTQEIVVGERLKDVYTLPNEMQFNSPMLNKSKYTFTEIPKEQL